MQGYILFDKNGARLTRNLTFSSAKDAGWLWTAGEVRKILDENDLDPEYYQFCELVEEDGDVNVYALQEIKKL